MTYISYVYGIFCVYTVIRMTQLVPCAAICGEFYVPCAGEVNKDGCF